MRTGSLIAIIVLLVLALYFTSEGAIGKEELLKNVSHIENETFDIIDHFEYVSMYDGNITVKNTINNVINSVAYPIIVMSNTIFPIGIYATSGEANSLIITVCIIYLFLYLITVIPTIIKSVLCIIFFIKEKREDKTKIWE